MTRRGRVLSPGKEILWKKYAPRFFAACEKPPARPAVMMNANLRVKPEILQNLAIFQPHPLSFSFFRGIVGVTAMSDNKDIEPSAVFVLGSGSVIA
jgi:hypothetical protein